MEDVISQFKTDADAAKSYLAEEVATLHAGRATPALVEKIKVNAYGSVSELQHVASITTPDSKTIIVQPWDKAVIEAVGKALTEAHLGMNPIVQDDKVLLTMPALTGERRAEILKLLSKKVEEARVKVRQSRDRAKGVIESSERAKEISEDEKFRRLKDLQKAVDEHTDAIEEIEKRKQNEIEG